MLNLPELSPENWLKVAISVTWCAWFVPRIFRAVSSAFVTAFQEKEKNDQPEKKKKRDFIELADGESLEVIGENDDIHENHPVA